MKHLKIGLLGAAWVCGLLAVAGGMGCERRDIAQSEAHEQSVACTRAADCDDGDVCTRDGCNRGGRCVHGAIPGCCHMNSECDDKSPCTEDRCNTTTARCERVAIAGCCGQGASCDDRDACTMDMCDSSTGTCGYTPVAGCCRFGSDCDDMNPCTEDYCDTGHKCVYRTKNFCCRQDTDCGTSSPCTQVSCDKGTGRCLYAGIAGCCTNDGLCDGSNLCVQGTCELGTRTCQLAWVNNCCINDVDCDDGSPCTRDVCDQGTRLCKFEAVSGGGCCASELECDDRNICTTDICDGTTHQCRYVPSGQCCNVDADCEDREVCTRDYCDLGAHLCQHEPVPNCTPADAGAPDAQVIPVVHGAGGCSALPGGAPGGDEGSARLVGGMLALAFAWALGRARRRRGTLPLGLAICAAWAMVRTAHADGTRPLDAQLFHAAPGWDRYFTLDGAGPPGHMLFSFVAGVSYSRNPMIAESGGVITTVIPYQVGIDLVPSLGLWNRLLLYAGVPLIPHRDAIAPLSQRGIGDVRLGFKLHLTQLDFDPGAAGIAFSTQVILPSGDKDGFGGGGVLQIEPAMTFDVRHGRWGFAVRGGAVLREQQRAFHLDVGHAASVAAGLRAPLWSDSLVAIGEIYGWIPLVGQVSTASAPFEALGGLRIHISDINLTVGAGRGVTSAYGTPDVRLFASLAFTPEPPPKKPTSYVPDPVWVRSVERIPTATDFPPLSDKDGDGILDAGDRCPTEAGPAITEGCPDKDTDGDGLVDRLDRCPQDKEIFNGVVDEDGCPDEGAPLVALTDKRVEIKQPIFFETNRAVIDPRSYLVLQAVASILRFHPEIKKVRVEGHTDRRGKPEKNMTLSQRRAEAVRSHLVLVHGIAPERLESKGFGASKPVAPNLTRTGRSLNRRVDFVIVERDNSLIPGATPYGQGQGQPPPITPTVPGGPAPAK